MESVLIPGDFNLHADDSLSCSTKEIFTLTEAFNFEQHVSKPTHRKDHILHSVFTLGLDISNVSVQDIHLSDHCLVLFDMHFSPEPKPLEVRSQRCGLISANTADSFSAIFDPLLFMDWCGLDVDNFIHCFTNHCVKIVDQVAPVKSNLSIQEKKCALGQMKIPWVWRDYVERLSVSENPLTLRCTDLISGILCPHTMRQWKMPDLTIIVSW